MHPIYNFETYIFDCDGVILNSNLLKMSAMKDALRIVCPNSSRSKDCLEYFARNFGKSRFHHIDHFVDQILHLPNFDRDTVQRDLLESYSARCKELYITAELTPGLLDFLERSGGSRYVVSGSEQNELRDVFEARKLTKYFSDVFGSPTGKSQHILEILEHSDAAKTVMVGDALSDYEAATACGIAFICYIPYSTAKNRMLDMADEHGFPVLYAWP